jgi:hypothetical protein
LTDTPSASGGGIVLYNDVVYTIEAPLKDKLELSRFSYQSCKYDFGTLDLKADLFSPDTAISDENVSNVVFSKSGNKIAYTSLLGGNIIFKIADIDGKNRRVIGSFPVIIGKSNCEMSPSVENIKLSQSGDVLFFNFLTDSGRKDYVWKDGELNGKLYSIDTTKGDILTNIQGWADAKNYNYMSYSSEWLIYQANSNGYLAIPRFDDVKSTAQLDFINPFAVNVGDAVLVHK